MSFEEKWKEHKGQVWSILDIVRKEFNLIFSNGLVEGSTRLCWMESSFVGTKPLDSPETPLSLATETEGCAVCNATTAGSCTCADSASSGLFLDLTPTRDDLQFHQNQRPGTSPSPSSTLNYSHHHHHHQQLQPQQQQRHHRGELLLA